MICHKQLNVWKILNELDLSCLLFNSEFRDARYQPALIFIIVVVDKTASPKHLLSLNDRDVRKTYISAHRAA